MKRVLIIGAGALGNSIAKVLKKKRVSVETWDINPKKMKRPKPLVDMARGADAVFLCIPAHAVRETAIKLLPLLRKQTIILSFSKGLEPETGETIDAVLGDVLPRGQYFGVVSGPLLAAELRAGFPGVAVIASSSAAVRIAMRNLFRGTTILVELSADMRSVAVLGIIKNIYTIALGAADGLRWGKNIKGKMLVCALEEMKVLLPMLGGAASALYGFAGVGDLVATGYSPESRNYQFGYALGQKRTSTAFCEGPASIAIVKKRLGKKIQKLVLLEALMQSIRDPKTVSANLHQVLEK